MNCYRCALKVQKPTTSTPTSDMDMPHWSQHVVAMLSSKKPCHVLFLTPKSLLSLSILLGGVGKRPEGTMPPCGSSSCRKRCRHCARTITPGSTQAMDSTCFLQVGSQHPGAAMAVHAIVVILLGRAIYRVSLPFVSDTEDHARDVRVLQRW